MTENFKNPSFSDDALNLKQPRFMPADDDGEYSDT